MECQHSILQSSKYVYLYHKHWTCNTQFALVAFRDCLIIKSASRLVDKSNFIGLTNWKIIDLECNHFNRHHVSKNYHRVYYIEFKSSICEDCLSLIDGAINTRENTLRILNMPFKVEGFL